MFLLKRHDWAWYPSLGNTVSVSLPQLPGDYIPLTSASAILCPHLCGLRPRVTGKVLKIAMLVRLGHFLIALVRRCSQQGKHAWVKPTMQRGSSGRCSLSRHPGKGRLGAAVPPNAQLAHGPSSSAGIIGGQCERDIEKRFYSWAQGSRLITLCPLLSGAQFPSGTCAGDTCTLVWSSEVSFPHAGQLHIGRDWGQRNKTASQSGKEREMWARDQDEWAELGEQEYAK